MRRRRPAVEERDGSVETACATAFARRPLPPLVYLELLLRDTIMAGLHTIDDAMWDEVLIIKGYAVFMT